MGGLCGCGRPREKLVTSGSYCWHRSRGAGPRQRPLTRTIPGSCGAVAGGDAGLLGHLAIEHPVDNAGPRNSMGLRGPALSSIQSIMPVPASPLSCEVACWLTPGGTTNVLWVNDEWYLPQGIPAPSILQAPLTRSMTLCQMGAAPVIPTTFPLNWELSALPDQTPTTTFGV